jgi:hypothetical protein
VTIIQNHNTNPDLSLAVNYTVHPETFFEARRLTASGCDTSSYRGFVVEEDM